MEEKTICAISTPIGNGGISIVRMSGPKCKQILQSITTFDTSKMEPRKLYLAKINTQNFDDQALVVWFKEPFSYTGEDLVEIQCHGGIVIANGILHTLLQNGCCLAENGEFTKRAFVNGKISLDRAEGVIDMINAQSEQAVKAGFDLLSGKLKDIAKQIQDNLTTCQAQIEVAIDYPEEDLTKSTVEEVKQVVTKSDEQIKELLSTVATGKLVKNGINVLILGKPNAGKSSLLNALLGYDRAIVSNIEGTTRDTVEESFVYQNMNFNLIDTAGIREADNLVEKIGIDRAKANIAKADIILVVLDASRPTDEQDEAILQMTENNNRIIVVNKIDAKESKISPKDCDFVEISATQKTNIENLKQKIYDKVVDKNMLTGGLVITNTRHADALERAHSALLAALQEIEMQSTFDLLIMDIKDAWLALGEITGENSNEAIINTIFEKFCVGK